MIVSALSRLTGPALHTLGHAVIAAVAALCAGSSIAAVPGVELVSTTTIPSVFDSTGPSGRIIATAADGRFTLFWSAAIDLVPGDTNAADDLFLHDALDGSIERINLASDGGQSESNGYDAYAIYLRGGISNDGRHVVFASNAALVPEAVGKPMQIYRRDRTSGTTELISRGSDGMPAESGVAPGPMTPDGRYVVFSTSAPNFPHGVPADSPVHNQIYRYDTTDGSMVRVTVSFDGQPTYGDIENLDVSDDGRFVMFWSGAANMVPGDTALLSYDIFLRDLLSSSTQQVNVTGSGEPSGGMPISASGDVSSIDRLSADGRYAVFYSYSPLVPEDTDQDADVYRFDRISGTSELVSSSVGGSMPLPSNGNAAISADGSRVLYQSYPPELYLPSRTFVRDLAAGTQTSYEFGSRLRFPFRQALSDDGTRIFLSNVALEPSTPFEQVYRFDTTTATLTRLSRPSTSSTVPSANGHSGGLYEAEAKDGPSASADARYVAFASSASNLVVGDTNGVADIFIRDRLAGTTERISLTTNRAQSACASKTPTLTPDARYIVFTSCGALAAPASGTRDEVYRYDRLLQTMEVVSVNLSGQLANGGSSSPDVSANGTVVTFNSTATDLVPQPVSGSQVYVRDMATGTTTLVSRSLTGGGGNSYSYASRVSGNGRFVGYSSDATDLVANDTNGRLDAYSFDRVTQSTERISVSSSGAQSAWHARFSGYSHDGLTAIFLGLGEDLAPGVPSGREHAYLRNRGAQTTVLIGVPSDPRKEALEANISADGRFVSLVTYAGSGVTAYNDQNQQKLFVLDRSNDQYRALTWFAAHTSMAKTRNSTFSADGNLIAFQSTRSELVDNDGNGQISDIFLVVNQDRIFAYDFGTAP
ncbi:MAG: hypothetical protein AMXMBFR59_21020 [Rhodanobacteraceae bacterium]